jgi:hypothetical protein
MSSFLKLLKECIQLALRTYLGQFILRQRGVSGGNSGPEALQLQGALFLGSFE